ncbi:MAG: DUF192 domain-containing protein [Vicinamibacteraceae bacterium]
MAHCLAPLVRDPQGRFGLWNTRSGEALATRVVAAFDSGSRRQGLLGRHGLESGEALVLAPCSSVHTAFMRFPLDLIFLGRDGRVVKTAAAVQPWRIRAAWRAFAVVELPTGSVARSGTRSGDVIELRTIV